MAILEGYKKNFETLQKAADNGDLALMECTDRKTGQIVNVVCAVERHPETPEEEYHMIPLAKMFDGNPYEELNPPMVEKADRG
jgi:hypothetical protein